METAPGRRPDSRCPPCRERPLAPEARSPPAGRVRLRTQEGARSRRQRRDRNDQSRLDTACGPPQCVATTREANVVEVTVAGSPKTEFATSPWVATLICPSTTSDALSR